MHERLAAEDTKEGIPHRLGLVDSAIERFDIYFSLLGSHIDPTALAAQIATVDNRYIEERREELAAFESSLMFLNTAQSLPTRLVGKLPQQTFVGLPEQPFGHAKVHRKCFLKPEPKRGGW